MALTASAMRRASSDTVHLLAKFSRESFTTKPAGTANSDVINVGRSTSPEIGHSKPDPDWGQRMKAGAPIRRIGAQQTNEADGPFERWTSS